VKTQRVFAGAWSHKKSIERKNQGPKKALRGKEPREEKEKGEEKHPPEEKTDERGTQGKKRKGLRI